MAHTIEDLIIELADKYTVNHSNESYYNNKAMLEEFYARVDLKFYPHDRFSSYEEYVNYLKEQGLAFDAPEGMYKNE